MTRLLLLGVSHHSAPVDVREQLDFAKRGLDEALATLAEQYGVGEAVVLSTCNRAEIYATCADVEQTRRDITRFLSDFNALRPEAIAPHIYEYADRDAAKHLFRVASGLDSLVVGEPQILGQVKDAYTRATDHAHTGALLNRLFHVAFTVGKRVRTETAVGQGAVSVSYAAVALAHKIFGSLEDLNVLLLGAGEMGKLTALHLRAQDVGRISIASRTGSRSEAIAAEMDAVAIDWTDVQTELARSDILITVTGATDPILSRANLESAMATRRYRPLFIIDIAVPRDVDPAAGEIEQVFLYNIDDLQSVVHENVAKRQTEIAHAEAIVDEEVQSLVDWLKSRDAVPTVVALRRRFEAIRQSELERLRPKLAGLPPEAQARVEEVTRLIVEKLLYAPTEQLKALPDHDTIEAYSGALTHLFDLASTDQIEAPAKRSARSNERPARDKSSVTT